MLLRALSQRAAPASTAFGRRAADLPSSRSVLDNLLPLRGMATAAARMARIGELKPCKPTSPGRRHRVVIDKAGLWRGRPEPSLTTRIAGQHQAGRNNTGQITTRRRSAPHHRRLYRMIDFHRRRADPAVVERLEYDPNRSAFIALIQYAADGQRSYILAPQGLSLGDTVECGEEAPFTPGNAMPLRLIPEGTRVHNVELHLGRGGALCRAAGTSARLQSKDESYALLNLQSGEVRQVPVGCTATIGVVSNEQHKNRVLGKAGAAAWVGRRPSVRGVAMNPVDHPHGGGEGKTSGGRKGSMSPWGWYTKGLRTRNKKQHSSKLIVRRRNHEKLHLSTINKGSW